MSITAVAALTACCHCRAYTADDAKYRLPAPFSVSRSDSPAPATDLNNREFVRRQRRIHRDPSASWPPAPLPPYADPFAFVVLRKPGSDAEDAPFDSDYRDVVLSKLRVLPTRPTRKPEVPSPTEYPPEPAEIELIEAPIE